MEATDILGDGGKLIPKSASSTKELSADRIDIIETNEEWEVRVDDIFWGDYVDKESSHVAEDLVSQPL
ncbi:hypothetical protein [Roseospirillum parvum]|uniref:hypothetical protein n=1 Tax=Roseospirillum parvum TaxID=83401 RepID=UPI001160E031|nr:hypothetical protein [Roseospirillum parvum]